MPKYAYLICGPESSGTGYVTKIFEKLYKSNEKYFRINEYGYIYGEGNYIADKYIKNELVILNTENTKKWHIKLDQNNIDNNNNYYFIKHIGIPFVKNFVNINYIYKQLVLMVSMSVSLYLLGI